MASGLSISQLVSTAWASVATFRGSYKRGGANGARACLLPQRNWEANQPEPLSFVIQKLEAIQKEFNLTQSSVKKISLADLLLLGGCASIEAAAKNAGHVVEVPLLPGRVDASQDNTDISSFAALEPEADGFRNYLKTGLQVNAAEMLSNDFFVNLLGMRTTWEKSVSADGVMEGRDRVLGHQIRRPSELALRRPFYVGGLTKCG
jgi:catalase-peroxidase